MAGGNLGKNNWALFLMILAGIVIGGFIGWLTKDVSFLSWLNFGQSFGLSNPIVLDLWTDNQDYNRGHYRCDHRGCNI